jgi:Papain-like cysteine protease AvrRpt2
MPNIHDYRQIRQEADLWCWAAVGVSMSEYYGHGTMTQCAFVRRAVGGDDCPNMTFSLPGSLSLVPCLAGAPLGASLALDDLRNQLLFGFPVCLRLQLAQGLGHVVVAVRCSSGSDAFVTILDPAEEGSVQVPYHVLTLGGYKGAWVDTCLTS